MRTCAATLVLFFFSTVCVWAQHDLVKDGNPVTGMTTEHVRDKSSSGERQDRMKIKPTEVPPLLQNTLGRNEFTGWEQNDLYYDQNSGHYMLEMDTVHHYLFDEAGNSIDPGQKTNVPATTPLQDTSRLEGRTD